MLGKELSTFYVKLESYERACKVMCFEDLIVFEVYQGPKFSYSYEGYTKVLELFLSLIFSMRLRNIQHVFRPGISGDQSIEITFVNPRTLKDKNDLNRYLCEQLDQKMVIYGEDDEAFRFYDSCYDYPDDDL